MYEISKNRLLQIAKDSPQSKVKIKQWYPDLFKIKRGWCVIETDYSKYIVFVDKEEQSDFYGFRNNNHSSYYINVLDDDYKIEYLNNQSFFDNLLAIGKYSQYLDENITNDRWSIDDNGNVYNVDNDNLFNVKSGWNMDLCYWRGLGWYATSDDYHIVYKERRNSSSHYGFVGGVWCDEIWITNEVTLRRVSDEFVKPYMINHIKTIGYTAENVMNIDGSIDRRGFWEDINQWAFFNNHLYTERGGHGGYTVYSRGEFANKRI